MTLGLELENTRLPRSHLGRREASSCSARRGRSANRPPTLSAIPSGAFEVAAVAGGRDPLALAKVARELGARFAALADPSGYGALKEALQGSGIEAAAGRKAVIEAALQPADIVMGAIAGTAGVEPTYAALVGRPHGRARQQGMPRLRRGRLHPPGQGDGNAASARRQRA